MIYLVWLLSLAAAFGLGSKLHDITSKIEAVQTLLKEKVDKQPDEPEPVSEVIDPLDEVQTAMYEHHKMMEKLNL